MRIAWVTILWAGCSQSADLPQLRPPTYQEWLDASDTAREIDAEREQ
jgi:hypothetical protein